MTTLAVEALDMICADLCTSAGLRAPIRRQPIRVWSKSGVERVTFPKGRTAILKYATHPFTAEARVLRVVAERGVPVPKVLATALYPDILVMLLEDLGDPIREATDADGADAAAYLHTVDVNPVRLAVWGSQQLSEIPDSAIGLLAGLRASGRLPQAGDLMGHLGALARRARALTVGADMPPFGLVHGELHPTSIHIGRRGWHLIDFAMAFIGPGLLDLATWQGTRNPPDPDRLAAQIHAYTAAGGDPRAHQPRGGLPPAVWALGWHRLWSTAWFLRQATAATDDTDDKRVEQIIRRQLTSAVSLLC